MNPPITPERRRNGNTFPQKGEPQQGHLKTVIGKSVKVKAPFRLNFIEKDYKRAGGGT
jgi:hypothetical protein